MDLSAERFLPTDPDTTWTALNDPAVLQACIPGCERFERIAPDRYEMQMLAKVGPVSARFKGAMQITDTRAPTGYTLSFEGQGGAVGFAKGRAEVGLAAETRDGVRGTLMRYAVTAQVGGKLAQIGSRLVDGAARAMADDFFARFAARFAAAAPPAAAPTLWQRFVRWLARLFARG